MNSYVIVARYRNAKDEMVVRCTYGPYTSREEAEKANNETLNFPSPEYNLIVPMWYPEDKEEEDQKFLARISGLVSRVDLGMNCDIRVGRDEKIPNGRFFLQIRCFRKDVITKDMGYGFGGKAYLSTDMTDSEIFQIIFGLFKGYWEHEARENFEIDELRPFGPHISTEALLSVAKKVDVRSAKHVEDRELTPEFISDVLDKAEIEAIEKTLEDPMRYLDH